MNEMPQSTIEKPHEVIVCELDMSGAWDKESMIELLMEQIKKMGIYSENILIRGFDGKKLAEVKKDGFDNKTAEYLYVSEEKDLMSSDKDLEVTAYDCAMEFDVPAFAIYDKRFLVFNDTNTEYAYDIKKSDVKRALLAVITLKNI